MPSPSLLVQVAGSGTPNSLAANNSIAPHWSGDTVV
jgi:hypothetical protein